MVALGLEADMHELGFNTCMAANGRQAFRYAMTQRPDVALMDINLEGAAKGLRLPEGFETFATYPLSLSLDTPTPTPSSAYANEYRERHSLTPFHERNGVYDSSWLSPMNDGLRVQ